jgi:hypothetical protein
MRTKKGKKGGPLWVFVFQTVAIGVLLSLISMYFSFRQVKKNE